MSTTNPTVFNKRLGAAVRARRIACGLSQDALAAQIGVTFQQQQKREKGINRISAEGLVLSATVLKTTPQELIDAATAQETPITDEAPRDEMGDRMRVDTMRRLSALSPERQLIAQNIIKTLSKEEAA
jgi:transcriptional regulator with XRE-family HTH domain